MPLTTNLSVSPYFDDYDTNSEYYRILFKPATAVQVREMNQLQAMLQHQIEEFGDHILRSGTILSGCQFSFKYSMPYVKILDNAESGAAVDVARYTGYFVEGQTNKVNARITHTIAGFEGSDPDLNTLYVEYTDSGTNFDIDGFVEDEVLKIYSADKRLHDIIITDPSSGFANSDTVVILSAIEVSNVTSGTSEGISLGSSEVLLDDSGTPTVRVETYAAQEVLEEENTVLLRIKPVDSDLAPTPDATFWENLEEGTTLIGQTTGQEVKVVKIRGTGATGKITTTRTGSIASAEISTGGKDYDILPYVTLYSTTATTLQVGQLTLTAQDYVTRVKVASSAQFTDPIGYGFGVNVTEGKIYQKGHFLKVDTQFAIVSKYSNTPSDLSVGFDTTESIVNVFTDSTLYDNAQGFSNEGAPGANRLKLIPRLVAKTSAEEESDAAYFPIIKFNNGRPFAINELTQYGKLGDMIARRTYEESGNYTLDPFRLATKSSENIANTDTHFTYVIDPGHAYINGYRVKTIANFIKEVPKGLEVLSETALGRDMEYANYIIVNNLTGVFDFKNADDIELYSTAASKLDDANGPASGTAGMGTQVGSAKIRSIVLENGTPGTPSATYRLHLFDITMQSGKNFQRDVRSVYSSAGSLFGAADVVLTSGSEYTLRELKSTGTGDANGEFIPASYRQKADIYGSTNQSLIVDTGRATTLDGDAANNVTYTYRTSTDDLTVGSAGTISISAAASTIFPYIGNLTDAERKELILVPNQDLVAGSTFASGLTFTTDTSGTYTLLTATAGTPNFSSNVQAGDWITDGVNTSLIIEVVGQDAIRVIKNGSYPTAGTLKRVFPAYVPINRFTASSTAPYSSLIVDLGITFSSDITNALTATYNLKSENTSPIAFTVRRKRYVKLTTAAGFTKEANRSLGIPGIFRLRAVYNGTTTAATDITNEFFVDMGQTANYWGLGSLRKNDTSSVSLAATILVEVDYLEPAARGGLKTVDSYPIDDEKDLDALTTAGTNIHNLEIPVITVQGITYDLREAFDFRPFVDQTAADATTDATASTDPSGTIAFTGLSGLKFPRPQGDIIYDIRSYKGRTDEIMIDIDGDFHIAQDTNKLDKSDPNAIVLYKVDVAPYPSLPQVLSTDITTILYTNVISERDTSGYRGDRYSIKATRIDDQNEGYTMSDIAKLERRLEALEYNQNISELEDSVKNRKIPSSVDSTLERFKFGFFVDNFENYDLANIQNPEYNASIYEYVLQPARGTSTIDYKLDAQSGPYRTGNKVTFPFSRKRLLSQKFATYGPYIPEPQPPAITDACQFVSNRNTKNIGDSTGSWSKLQNVWEEASFLAPDFTDNSTRNIDLTFYIPRDKVAFEIIQSSTKPTRGLENANIVWSSASQTPVAVTPPDAIALYKKLYPVKNSRNSAISYADNPWFVALSAAGTITLTGSPSGTINYNCFKGAGKISIPYDYTKGKWITVRAIKGGEIFNYEICYPTITVADPIFDTGATERNTRPPSSAKGTFLYTKCIGTTLVTYVSDGNYGTQVGNRAPNSTKCGYVIPVPNPVPVPEPVIPAPPACPPSGTVAKTFCTATIDKTLNTFVFTGKRGTNGKCAIKLSTSDPNNVPVCKYVAPKPPPPVCTSPVRPAPKQDDGCDNPTPTNPDCSIAVAPPVKPAVPPVVVRPPIIRGSPPPVVPPVKAPPKVPPPMPDPLPVPPKVIKQPPRQPAPNPIPDKVPTRRPPYRSPSVPPSIPPIATNPVTPATPDPAPKTTHGGHGCFVANTKILMSDFSYKNIQDIVVGDEVVGQHGEFNDVVELFPIPVELRPMATINDKLTLTAYHPILTSEGWRAVDAVKAAQMHPDMEISQLEIGDTIITLTDAGMTSSEVVINIHKFDDSIEVFNFHVDGDNTYTADNVVVHNKLTRHIRTTRLH